MLHNSLSVVILSGIMMAMSGVVNARADQNPKINPALPKGEQKAAKLAKSEFTRIFEFIMKTGGTDRLKPGIAELIGLKGELPVKGLDNKVLLSDGKEYRECSAVYADDSEEVSDKKHPICVYFNKLVSSGHTAQSHWYRVTLDGKLERAVIHYSKLDDNDEGIPGADSTVVEDVNSPEVQKSFKSEMAFWLNKQKKTPSAKKKAEAGAVADPTVSPAP